MGRCNNGYGILPYEVLKNCVKGNLVFSLMVRYRNYLFLIESPVEPQLRVVLINMKIYRFIFSNLIQPKQSS